MLSRLAKSMHVIVGQCMARLVSELDSKFLLIFKFQLSLASLFLSFDLCKDNSKFEWHHVPWDLYAWMAGLSWDVYSYETIVHNQ